MSESAEMTHLWEYGSANYSYNPNTSVIDTNWTHHAFPQGFQNYTIEEFWYFASTLTVLSLEYFFDNIRFFFVLVNARDVMKPNVDLVPRYVENMLPMFVFFGAVEILVILIKCRQFPRSNDLIASLSQGIFQECVR